jgi:hypothetical protein
MPERIGPTLARFDRARRTSRLLRIMIAERHWLVLSLPTLGKPARTIYQNPKKISELHMMHITKLFISNLARGAMGEIGANKQLR